MTRGLTMRKTWGTWREMKQDLGARKLQRAPWQLITQKRYETLSTLSLLRKKFKNFTRFLIQSPSSKNSLARNLRTFIFISLNSRHHTSLHPASLHYWGFAHLQTSALFWPHVSNFIPTYDHALQKGATTMSSPSRQVDRRLLSVWGSNYFNMEKAIAKEDGTG